MVTAETVFGLSVAELAIVVVGIGYVVSLVTDWRPMRALRSENGELRDALKSAQERIGSLEAKVRELEKATVPVLQAEIVEVARILDRLVEKLDHLDGSVRSNTAAVEVLAKRNVIDDALTEGAKGGS